MEEEEEGGGGECGGGAGGVGWEQPGVTAIGPEGQHPMNKATSNTITPSLHGPLWSARVNLVNQHN